MSSEYEYLKVRAGFVAQGSSLTRWCRTRGIQRQNARDALLGIWKGPKGQAMRRQLLEESGAVRHG